MATLSPAERAAWRRLIRLEQRDAKLFGMYRLPSERNRFGRRYVGWNRYERVHAAREVIGERIESARSALAPTAEVVR